MPNGTMLVAAAVAALVLLVALAPAAASRWAPYFWADLRAFGNLALSAGRCRRRFHRRPPVALLDVFQENVRRRPRRPLLLFQNEVYTYDAVDRRSNAAARCFARRLGLGPGETAAVFCPNCPTYVWTWLALAKLGCPMACLNTNARGRALRHAVAAARAPLLLASAGE